MIYFFWGFWLLNIVHSRIVDIIMATDDHFIYPTFVGMASLLENAKQSTFYRVSVLVPGEFRHKNKNKLSSLKTKYNYCNIDFIAMGDLYKNISTKKFPAPTYYRLQAGSLFPERKKCIHLDGDVIVRHDLAEMYDIDMEEYYVAGVCHGDTVPKRNYHERLKIPDLNQYVCAGVLLMNLENFRKYNLEEQFLKLLEIKGKNMKKFVQMYADQDIINSVCYGKILCLPPKFDFLVNMYLKGNLTVNDPMIVHFAGWEKPWTDPHESTFHEEYWSYFFLAKNTLSSIPKKGKSKKLGGKKRKSRVIIPKKKNKQMEENSENKSRSGRKRRGKWGEVRCKN